MTDELQPNDLEEGETVELEWSTKGNPGSGTRATGEVTRVWRPDGEVEQFTVQTDEFALNVYTDYRDPPVERVEGDEDPDAETVGRLDGITRTRT